MGLATAFHSSAARPSTRWCVSRMCLAKYTALSSDLRRLMCLTWNMQGKCTAEPAQRRCQVRQVRQVELDKWLILWYFVGKSQGGPVADSGATSPHACRSRFAASAPGVG